MKINEDLKELPAKYHALYKAAIRDMEKVLPSPEFTGALMALVDEYKVRLEGETSRLKKISVEEAVTRLIKESQETMHIRGYYTSANVIGYGLPSDDITRVNTRYLQGESADVAKDRAERGSNLAHEKGHDAGFGHDSKPTARRPNSWCYLIGAAYKIAHREIFADQYGTITKPPVTQTKPVKVYKKKPWWSFLVFWK